MDRIDSLMQGLSPEQSARLMRACQSVANEAREQLGISPSLEELLNLATIKAQTLENVELDLSNSLFQLQANIAANAEQESAQGQADTPPAKTIDDYAHPAIAMAENRQEIARRGRPKQHAVDIDPETWEAMTPEAQLTASRWRV